MSILLSWGQNISRFCVNYIVFEASFCTSHIASHTGHCYVQTVVSTANTNTWTDSSWLSQTGERERVHELMQLCTREGVFTSDTLLHTTYNLKVQEAPLTMSEMSKWFKITDMNVKSIVFRADEMRSNTLFLFKCIFSPHHEGRGEKWLETVLMSKFSQNINTWVIQQCLHTNPNRK